jgi:hypothetical protein
LDAAGTAAFFLDETAAIVNVVGHKRVRVGSLRDEGRGLRKALQRQNDDWLVSEQFATLSSLGAVLSISTMSFARSTLGLSARLVVSRRAPTQSSLLAYRLLSTTPRRLHATPVATTTAARKSPPLGQGTLSAADEPDKNVNPYKTGLGALDKAVHLFFLTEILKGA